MNISQEIKTLKSINHISIYTMPQDDHNCAANLSPNENDIVITPGKEVHVYRDCTVCGDELVVEYEYVETYME